jgi:hypothetical protein
MAAPGYNMGDSSAADRSRAQGRPAGANPGAIRGALDRAALANPSVAAPPPTPGQVPPRPGSPKSSVPTGWDGGRPLHTLPPPPPGPDGGPNGLGKALDRVAPYAYPAGVVFGGLRRANRSQKKGWWTKQEQKMSQEGLDSVYGRGTGATQHGLRTGDLHFQPSSDSAARQQHLVSERYDPTIPENAYPGAPITAGPSATPTTFDPAAVIPAAARRPDRDSPGMTPRMMADQSPRDILHAETSAGPGNNIWLGGDPQHTTATSGINVSPVRPIRKLAQ